MWQSHYGRGGRMSSWDLCCKSSIVISQEYTYRWLWMICYFWQFGLLLPMVAVGSRTAVILTILNALENLFCKSIYWQLVSKWCLYVHNIALVCMYMCIGYSVRVIAVLVGPTSLTGTSRRRLGPDPTSAFSSANRWKNFCRNVLRLLTVTKIKLTNRESRDYKFINLVVLEVKLFNF